MKKYIAEMIGTAVLVLMGCGSAVIAGEGIGLMGISFAFGLSVVAMAYAIGGISGCHINPAITLAMWINKKISGKDAGMYMIFQVIGAFIGSTLLWVISGDCEPAGANAISSNYTLVQGIVAEVVFTFLFLMVVFGATSDKAPAGFGGLAIGLSLVLIHLVCIPITGTSVNPARSIAPAVFQGGDALCQLWVFIVAPFVGAAIAAVTWKGLFEAKK